MKPLLILICHLVVTAPLLAMPEIDLIRYYDEGGANDRFQDIYLCANGEYVACGLSGENAWVMRLDDEGDPIWSLTDQVGGYFSVIEADNSDIVLGGGVAGYSLRRLTADGEEVWSRTYAPGRCRGVIELKSGEFALCGRGNGVGFLSMVSAAGDMIWGLDGFPAAGNNSYGHFALRETEGGIVTVGTVNNDFRREWEAYATKANLDGGHIWTRRYQQENTFAFSAMCSIPGGDFACGGWYTVRPDGEPGGAVLNVTRINSEGDLGDQDLFQIDAWDCDHQNAIARLPDGGFVTAGLSHTWGEDGNFHYPRVVRSDQAGRLLWETRFEEEVHERGNGGGNQFCSAVVDDRSQIYLVGGMIWPGEGRGLDGWLIRFEPDQLLPMIFRRSPEDSILTVLLNDSIKFEVRARDRYRNELVYEWQYVDSLRVQSEDTMRTILFDTVGVRTVVCEISNEHGVVNVGWSITVTDLYIFSHSPDTLDLMLRRGSTVDFVIDSVAAVQSEDTIQYQWLVNDLDRQEEVSGGDAQATSFDFTRSGHYIVEGMAYRGESHDEVVWDVTVRGAIWSFIPEEAGLTGLIGSNVEFQIVPTVSDSLNWYTWLYDGGMIREGRDSVFVMNLFELGEHTITGILADSVESDTVNWTVLVESNSIPPSLSLEPLALSLSASPNPFNSTLTIRFSIGAQGLAPLRLAVYDLSGREVARLLDNSKLQALNSKLNWDASAMPAGVYLVRLQSGSDVQTRKVVLLR